WLNTLTICRLFVMTRNHKRKLKFLQQKKPHGMETLQFSRQSFALKTVLSYVVCKYPEKRTVFKCCGSTGTSIMIKN
ncbi:hypothetical protein NQ318_020848, partial [Aromia moschata]